MADQIEVPAGEGDDGARLDKWLSEQTDQLSRTRVKSLIESGDVANRSGPVRDPRHKVIAGEFYVITLPAIQSAEPEPENIPLAILFEDEHIVVVDKAPGMVVHPAAGSWSGTLVNALLHHCGDTLSGIGGVARPGIVHRLDKDTSGVLVVAKSDPAHRRLVEMFQAHDLDRTYVALTRGVPKPRSGTIDTHIARSNSDRKKMAVVRESKLAPSAVWHDPSAEDSHQERGKRAITNYNTLETYGRLDERTALPSAGLVECVLETGRTHQIRVHMAHIGTPLIGDRTYGRNKGIKAFGKGDAFDTATATARKFGRQALHARRLAFAHPVTGKPLSFETPPPEDMAELIDALRAMPG